MQKRTFDQFTSLMDVHQFISLMTQCPDPTKARRYYNEIMGFDVEGPQEPENIEFVSSRDTQAFDKVPSERDAWPDEVREFVESLEAEGHEVHVQELTVDDLPSTAEGFTNLDDIDDLMAQIGAMIMSEPTENEDTDMLGSDLYDAITSAEVNSSLPDWAAKRCVDGDPIERMTQLCTRNGQVTGNATIFDIVSHRGDSLFYVITDAMNVMKLTFNEMVEMFHPPLYIMKDFPNNETDLVGEFLNDWYIDNAGYPLETY